MPESVIDEGVSLFGLFVTSFLAATLLPGGSEAVLFAVLQPHPQLFWPAIILATAGNTLGGMSSYLIGRCFSETSPSTLHDKLHRYGSTLLVFAWLPIVGDGLCIAAGWLKLNPWSSAIFMGFGKFARYWVVARLSA